MIDKIFMVLLFVIMLAACESDEQLPFKTAKSKTRSHYVLIDNLLKIKPKERK